MASCESSSGRMSARILVASLSLAVVFAAVVVAFSHPVAAGPGPLTVRGYIRDNAGNPLEGASITVNIRYAPPPGGTIRSTLYDTSDSTGFYSVSFAYTEWDVGDIIEVIATWHGHQENNYTDATVKPVQHVNVTYAFEIDEYGAGAIGLVVAGGFVGAVALVVLVRRKPRQA